MAARETVDKFEMLYGIRTGLTVLIAPIDTLDVPVDVRVQFEVDGGDLLITAKDRAAVLKKVPAQHIEQANRHGVIMFYEMKDDDVVRCTPCYKAGS